MFPHQAKPGSSEA